MATEKKGKSTLCPDSRGQRAQTIRWDRHPYANEIRAARAGAREIGWDSNSVGWDPNRGFRLPIRRRVFLGRGRKKKVIPKVPFLTPPTYTYVHIHTCIHACYYLLPTSLYGRSFPSSEPPRQFIQPSRLGTKKK